MNFQLRSNKKNKSAIGLLDRGHKSYSFLVDTTRLNWFCTYVDDIGARHIENEGGVREIEERSEKRHRIPVRCSVNVIVLYAYQKYCTNIFTFIVYKIRTTSSSVLVPEHVVVAVTLCNWNWLSQLAYSANFPSKLRRSKMALSENI